MTFITCNQNGSILCWLDEPKRNNKNGKWTAKYPIVDSNMNDKTKQLAKEVGMTWESDPIVIQF